MTSPTANAKHDVVHRNILEVGGLPKDYTNEDLAKLFGNFGTVTKAEIIVSASWSSEAGGIVEFEEAKSAKVAILEMFGYRLGAGTVRVQYTRQEPRPDSPQAVEPKQQKQKKKGPEPTPPQLNVRRPSIDSLLSVGSGTISPQNAMMGMPPGSGAMILQGPQTLRRASIDSLADSPAGHPIIVGGARRASAPDIQPQEEGAATGKKKRRRRGRGGKGKNESDTGSSAATSPQGGMAGFKFGEANGKSVISPPAYGMTPPSALVGLPSPAGAVPLQLPSPSGQPIPATLPGSAPSKQPPPPAYSPVMSPPVPSPGPTPLQVSPGSVPSPQMMFLPGSPPPASGAHILQPMQTSSLASRPVMPPPPPGFPSPPAPGMQVPPHGAPMAPPPQPQIVQVVQVPAPQQQPQPQPVIQMVPTMAPQPQPTQIVVMQAVPPPQHSTAAPPAAAPQPKKSKRGKNKAKQGENGV